MSSDQNVNDVRDTWRRHRRIDQKRFNRDLILIVGLAVAALAAAAVVVLW